MTSNRSLKFGLKGMMISSVLVGSLLQIEHSVKAEEGVQVATYDPSQKPGVAHVDVDKYNDYNAKAYWAKDMNWAIQKGLISGYQNQIHPTSPSKGKGNWIDPNGNLTEYQMLNVMLRYLSKTDFEAAKIDLKDKTASNFAYVEYQIAANHGIMTKGSTTNDNFAKQQVTRGQMAQALVSMHYGKSVTLQEAIDFMYANELTTGVNASEGQTLENFGANVKLSRSHIVAFIGRYDEVKNGNNLKDTLNNPSKYSVLNKKPDTTAPKFEYTKYDYSNLYAKFDTSKKFEFEVFIMKKELGWTMTMGDKVITEDYGDKGELGKKYTGEVIKTSYKNHTYNVGSQKDYDKIIDYVNKELAGKTYRDVKRNYENEEYNLKILERVMNDEITIIRDRNDPAFRTEENSTASVFNSVYRDAIDQGISFETLAMYRAASYYVDKFSSQIGEVIAPLERKHDIFKIRSNDYISIAYASQAIYDALGYNTAVVHKSRSTDYLIIELDGVWYMENRLNRFTKDSVQEDDFIKFAPTKFADKLSFIKIM